MATYNSLSDSDKAVVQNTVNIIRSNSGALARSFNVVTAIENDTNATGILASINSGETIPNTTNLAGADDMTQAELLTVFNGIKALRDDGTDGATPANLALWAKAAGINATIGA